MAQQAVWLGCYHPRPAFVLVCSFAQSHRNWPSSLDYSTRFPFWSPVFLRTEYFFSILQVTSFLQLIFLGLSWINKSLRLESFELCWGRSQFLLAHCSEPIVCVCVCVCVCFPLGAYMKKVTPWYSKGHTHYLNARMCMLVQHTIQITRYTDKLKPIIICSQIPSRWQSWSNAHRRKKNLLNKS